MNQGSVEAVAAVADRRKDREARDISILLKLDLVDQHLNIDPNSPRIAKLLGEIRQLLAPL